MPLYTDTLDSIKPAGDMICLVQSGALLRRIVVVNNNNEIPVGSKYHVIITIPPENALPCIEYFALIEERFDGKLLVIEHGEEYIANPSRRIPREGTDFEAEEEDVGDTNALLLLVGDTGFRALAMTLEREGEIDRECLLDLLDALAPNGAAYMTHYSVIPRAKYADPSD